MFFLVRIDNSLWNIEEYVARIDRYDVTAEVAANDSEKSAEASALRFDAII
jgi:hypothetical protein